MPNCFTDMDNFFKCVTSDVQFVFVSCNGFNASYLKLLEKGQNKFNCNNLCFGFYSQFIYLFIRFSLLNVLLLSLNACCLADERVVKENDFCR